MRKDEAAMMGRQKSRAGKKWAGGDLKETRADSDGLTVQEQNEQVDTAWDE